MSAGGGTIAQLAGGGALTAEQLESVLATAVRAPSLHNSQPWRFSVDGDDLHVWADRTRQLPRADPLGRELLISCGAAAFHAALAVRGLGRAADLQWAPTPADVDHVATIVVGGPRATTAEEARLLEAVPVRHTERGPFASTEVPGPLLGELVTAAQHEGATLCVEDRPERVLLLQAFAARAGLIQRRDAQLVEEATGRDRAGDDSRDGVPQLELPVTSADLRVGEPPPPRTAPPLLLVLCTDSDTPEAWGRAGSALARVLLVAAAAGLAVDPHTQVLEVPGLRWRLAQELGLLSSPQMLLRAGYPGGSGAARTGRRPASVVAPEEGPAVPS